MFSSTMDKPKLVGMISLRITRVRRSHEMPAADLATGAREVIQQVAFDTDGRAWGLVERLTRVDVNISRLTFDRFVAFPAIPFRPEEVVTEETWRANPDDVAESAPG